MKKNLKLILTFVLALVLTGCMKVNIVIDVDEKGKAQLGAEILYSEELLNSVGTTVEQMNEQMISEMNLPEGSEYEEVSKTIDGEKYVGVSFQQEVNDDYVAEVKDDKVSLKLPVDELKGAMGSFDESTLNTYGYSIETMKKTGVEMNMVFNMPGKATTNVGVADGSEVKIDLFDVIANPPSDDIVISSSIGNSSSNTMLYVGIGVAAVVIIGLALVLVKKNKNNSEETVINESVTPEAPIETTQPSVEETPVEPETVVEETPVEETKDSQNNE